MGITRDSRHKRSATGARHAYYRKKRQFELGRQAANTRIGPKRIHDVRVRGGNIKPRAPVSYTHLTLPTIYSV